MCIFYEISFITRDRSGILWRKGLDAPVLALNVPQYLQFAIQKCPLQNKIGICPFNKDEILGPVFN